MKNECVNILNNWERGLKKIKCIKNANRIPRKLKFSREVGPYLKGRVDIQSGGRGSSKN